MRPLALTALLTVALSFAGCDDYEQAVADAEVRVNDHPPAAHDHEGVYVATADLAELLNRIARLEAELGGTAEGPPEDGLTGSTLDDVGEELAEASDEFDTLGERLDDIESGTATDLDDRLLVVEGWGNHAAQGYLTSYTETDPVYASSVASGIVASDLSEWSDAASWGDHSLVGYLTSFTETDPVYASSVASEIGASDLSNWNGAAAWGDHSLIGYLTSYTETDPVYAASSASVITATDIDSWDGAVAWGDHATVGYLTSYTETDPIYAASAVSGIVASDLTNWDTAVSWGDHAIAGYLTSYTETDPLFAASDASAVTTTDINAWDGAVAWGDHGAAGYLTSYTETDPVYAASDASAITGADITGWNDLLLLLDADVPNALLTVLGDFNPTQRGAIQRRRFTYSTNGTFELPGVEPGATSAYQGVAGVTNSDGSDALFNLHVLIKGQGGVATAEIATTPKLGVGNAAGSTSFSVSVSANGTLLTVSASGSNSGLVVVNLIGAAH